MNSPVTAPMPRSVAPTAAAFLARRMGLPIGDIVLAVGQGMGAATAAIVEELIPGGVTSTYDEAVTLRKYAEREKLRSVNIVTSSFHTRRARWYAAA